MKRNINYILVFILLLSLFTGCQNVSESKNNYNERLHEEIDSFVQDYQEQNDIDILSSDFYGDEDIIFYETPDAYAIASFYQQGETHEIDSTVSSIPKYVDEQSVVYVQVKGLNSCYIGILIRDENLMKKSDSVKVDFDDNLNSGVSAIQMTLNGQNNQVFAYSADEIQAIKGVIILNADGKTVYDGR